MNDLSFEQSCISARNIVCLQVLHIFAFHFVERLSKKINIKTCWEYLNNMAFQTLRKQTNIIDNKDTPSNCYIKLKVTYYIHRKDFMFNFTNNWSYD